MSCSADYYIVFWSGSATIMLSALAPPPPPPHTPLGYTRGERHACGGGGGGSQRRRRNRHYSTLYTGTPQVSSEQLTHKKCAKMYFCKHWQHLLAVLRIRDVYPESRIPDPDFYPSRIPDLGSRIPNPKTATKERGEKKLVVIPFYVATNFTKL